MEYCVMVTKISGSGTTTFGGEVVGVGAVKQVLNSLTSDKSSYVTGTSYAGVEVTPLTLSITPASTSHRIMVNYNMTFEGSTGSTLGFRLYRVVGGVPTLIGINTANTSQWNVTFVSPYDADNNSTPMPANYLFVDSPNTTSEVTYKLHLVTTNTTSYTMNLNRSTTDPKNTYEETTSSVTLTEVA